MRLLNKRRWRKGEMSRTIVIYSMYVLTGTLIFACLFKTYALFKYGATDLSDVLTFAAGSFGSELAMLAFKRILAKPNENENGGTY